MCFSPVRSIQAENEKPKEKREKPRNLIKDQRNMEEKLVKRIVEGENCYKYELFCPILNVRRCISHIVDKCVY